MDINRELFVNEIKYLFIFSLDLFKTDGGPWAKCVQERRYSKPLPLETG